MPNSFFYSINLLIKSDSHLQKAIASVIADESYFLENVQLILIDTVCSEQSIEICSEYNKKYPDNIWFVDAQGKSEAASYNDARGLCFGKYITYIDNYGEYSKKTLSSLQSKLLRNAKIPVLCVQPIISPSGGDERPYTDITGTGIIKLKEEPDRFILMLGCYFFNKKTGLCRHIHIYSPMSTDIPPSLRQSANRSGTFRSTAGISIHAVSRSLSFR